MNTAIVYLAHNEPSHIENLKKSLESLHQYWQWRTSFPIIIIFHEGLYHNTKTALKAIGPVIYFEEVKFEIPPWIERDRVPQNYFGSVGYRHMCRFFAGEFLRHPALQNYDYLWRLDCDSFLTRPLPYDPFQKLAEQDAVYGYLTSFQDTPEVTVGLLDAAKRFIESFVDGRGWAPDIVEKQKQHFLDGCKHWDRHLYYTNFEVLDLKAFRSKWFGYLKYFDFLDREGGIYCYRWGDHVIRHLGLSLFARPSEIYRFEGIGYRHQHFET